MEPRELVNLLLTKPTGDLGRPSKIPLLSFVGFDGVKLNGDNDPVFAFIARDRETQCEDRLFLVYSLHQGQVWLSNGFNRISDILKISFN